MQRNTGDATPDLSAAPGDVTLSTPTIDHNGNILLGTENGVLSLDKRANGALDIRGYSTAAAPDPPCAVCTLGTPDCKPVGRVSASPSVSPGNTVVFGSEGSDGRLFAIQERSSNRIDCNWVFPSPPKPGLGFRSSAALLINTLDLSLTSVFVGGRRRPPAGAELRQHRALGRDGERSDHRLAGARWNQHRLRDDAEWRALLAVSFGGVPFDPANIGVARQPAGAPFQPSPAVGTSIYAVGSAGALVAVSPPNRTEMAVQATCGSVDDRLAGVSVGQIVQRRIGQHLRHHRLRHRPAGHGVSGCAISTASCSRSSVA